MASERASQKAFLGVSALLFAASAAVTIVWCASMWAMGGMPMPGGWTMSMAWMRMPGQTWPGAAASVLGMSQQEPERRYLERRPQELEKIVWMCVEFGDRQTTKGAGPK